MNLITHTTAPADLLEEIGEGPWTLVPRSEWIEYVKQWLRDIGDLPANMPHYIVIDWQATADVIENESAESFRRDGTEYLLLHQVE